MCRLVGFKLSRNIDGLHEILGPLVSVSRYDPLLPGKVVGGHSDGWGLSIYDQGLGGVLYYKSGEPLYSQIRILERLIRSLRCPCKGIIHVRKASKSEPLGLLYAHPFISNIDDSILALAHNGGIDKYVVAEEIGYKGDLDKVSDTYMYFKLLIREYVKHGNIVEAIRNTINVLLRKKAVRTSINSLILFINNSTSNVYIIEDWEHFSGDKRRYYSIGYLCKGDLVVVTSSTVYDSLLDKGFNTCKPNIIDVIEVEGHIVKISIL